MGSGKEECMNKRVQQKEERRASILNTALTLFIRKGYDATKIADIAKILNTSVGLLFHYFDSKEKLYEVLIEDGFNAIEEEMSDVEGSPIEVFEVVAETIIHSLKTEAYTASLLFFIEQVQSNNVNSKKTETLFSNLDLVQKSIPLITKGQVLEEIKVGDPWALSVSFWRSLQGIAKEVSVQPKTPCPESTWIVDILRR